MKFCGVLLVDVVVIISQTRTWANDSWNFWERHLNESNGLRISWLKAKYVERKLSGFENELVKIGTSIPQFDRFWYLGLIMDQDE